MQTTTNQLDHTVHIEYDPSSNYVNRQVKKAANGSKSSVKENISGRKIPLTEKEVRGRATLKHASRSSRCFFSAFYGNQCYHLRTHCRFNRLSFYQRSAPCTKDKLGIFPSHICIHSPCPAVYARVCISC